MPVIVLLLAVLIAAPPQRGTAAKSAAGVARTPGQEAMDWFLSTVEEAPAHLVASARDQLTALRQNAPDQAQLAQFLAHIVAPSAMFRDQGGKVSATGQPPTIVTIDSGGSPPLQFTFEPEAVAGDRALVPLAIKSGTMTARGSIELTRENGAWRIAAADLGPQARWPRFDSPSFVPEMAKVVEDGLRQARASALAIKAQGTAMTVASAEMAFQSLNGGFSGPLECLTAPKICLSKYGDSPAPLSTMPSVDGYTAKFTAGPAPTAAELKRASASPRSLKTWSFAMSPASADMPGFCSDSTGLVCRLAAGAIVTGPACPAACQAIK